MSRLFYIFLLACLAAIFAACSDDTAHDYYADYQSSATELATMRDSCLREGDVPGALRAADSLAAIQSALIADYRAGEEQNESDRRLNSGLALILICSFCLILSLFLAHNIKKIRNGELEAKIFDSGSLAKELSGPEAAPAENTAELRRLIRELFTTRFTSLDRLSREYFEKKDVPALRSHIIKDFEREIDLFRQPENLKSIEKSVNECCDGVLTAVREAVPRVKDSDITFLALVIAGFSPKSVCLIQDLTIGNYYNKWTRLRARIADSSHPRKDEILQALEK